MCSHIRKSPDHWLCAPTRSLSQLITSFIGSWCQGIHHAPFVAWPIQSKFFKVLHLIFTKNISSAYFSICFEVHIIIIQIMQFSQEQFLGLLLNMLWSYTINLMCNFQRTNGLNAYSTSCTCKCSPTELYPYNFEKHGFSKLNRLVKPVSFKIYETNILLFHFSIERRWSSRRFSYGYLVTTSPQSLTLP